MVEIRDKALKYTTQAEVRTEYGLCSGVFEFRHGASCTRCEFQTPRPYNVTLVFDDLGEQSAFRLLGIDTSIK